MRGQRLLQVLYFPREMRLEHSALVEAAAVYERKGRKIEISMLLCLFKMFVRIAKKQVSFPDPPETTQKIRKSRGTLCNFPWGRGRVWERDYLVSRSPDL